MIDQQLGLSATLEEPLDTHSTLTFALRASGTRYDYLAFVGLTEVYALDLTALAGVRFR